VLETRAHGAIDVVVESLRELPPIVRRLRAS
jgi:hypothetical protein